MKNKTFKQKGAISVYVLMMASIAVTTLTSLAIFVASSQKSSSNEVTRQKALQIAERGVYYYRWYLAHNLDGKSQTQVIDFWQNGNPIGVGSDYNQVVTDFDGTEIGEFQLSVDDPDPDSTIVSIEVTGWTYRNPSITKTIKVRFRKESWSEYSVLANDYMRFGEGTVVYGPIHSNNGIRFDGTANNVVSSSKATFIDPDINQIKPGVWTSQPDESQVFLAGTEYPVAEIDFNSITSDLNYIRTEASNNGTYLHDDYITQQACYYQWMGGWPPSWQQVCYEQHVDILGYHITLKTDDTFVVTKVLDYSTSRFNILEESDPEIFSLPDNGLIFADKNVWLDGQINTAQLTIASADLDGSYDTNVYINNDIKYTNYDGSDIIGIIAEDNIRVGLYSEDNLEIDAALLAQKGSVGRDYYSGWSISSWVYRDEITIVGSIATNKRYGFAYTDGTGYNTRNLYFDNNLIYYPPPYFPTGDEYELDQWEEVR